MRQANYRRHSAVIMSSTWLWGGMLSHLFRSRREHFWFSVTTCPSVFKIAHSTSRGGGGGEGGGRYVPFWVTVL